MTTNLWQSDNPISKADEFWKQFLLLVRMTSSELGFLAFLEHVGSVLNFQNHTTRKNLSLPPHS